MPTLNLAYNKDLLGGTYTGYADDVSLTSKIGTLKQAIPGAANSFYINPAYGMFKVNADNIPAAYYVLKGQDYYNNAQTLNAESTNSFFCFYEEIKLSLGNADMFKFSIGNFFRV